MKKLIFWLFLVCCEVQAAPVNINTANAQQIADALPGIGIKKAQAIVADRESKGRFTKVEELLRVLGIGEKTLANIRGDILLTNPVVKKKSRKIKYKYHS